METKHELVFSAAELSVLRDRYKKLSDNEFAAFLDAAKRYSLNPLANQIYPQLKSENDPAKRAVTYVAQIDGYRLIADRTGAYCGNDDPVFDEEQTPLKATVTVYKLVSGVRCPFSATARWKQYLPAFENQQFMWKRMPHLMLGKCAEALALRKAFPAELSGLYTAEEMQQSEELPGKPLEPAPQTTTKAAPSHEATRDATAKRLQKKADEAKAAAKKSPPRAGEDRKSVV